MLAVRNYGIGKIAVDEVAQPVPGPEEVLIRVAYGGICGSDLHIYRKGMFVKNLPETMGHEFIGFVEQPGEAARGIKAGDTVSGDPRVSCGSCSWCKSGCHNLCPDLSFIGEIAPGCFAEYITMHQSKLIRIPPHVDLRQGALVEPLAVALYLLEKSQLDGNKTLGIIGAGPIGLLSAAAAKELYGSPRITVVDLNEKRLKTARLLGVNEILPVMPRQQAEQADVVIEAVGAEETFRGALGWLKPQGRLIMVGLFESQAFIDLNEILYKEINITGVNAYKRKHLEQAVDFLANRKVDLTPVISHIISLNQAESAFSMLAAGNSDAVKVLLKPQ
ncbi:MAG: alcohol dehydrogenase catalytic domain-containing protein [Bacillota bacterium]